MNVIIEYPEDFPLDEVDRKVYSRQIREILRSSTFSTLDIEGLRKRSGQSTQRMYEERHEIEHLHQLAVGEQSSDVTERLTTRLGEYLNVRIRLADFVTEPTPDREDLLLDQQGKKSSPSLFAKLVMYLVIPSVVAIGAMYGAHLLISHQTAHASTSPSAPVIGAVVTPAGSSSGVEPFEPIVDSTDLPTVDLTLESAHPGIDLTSLRRIMPADGGLYLVKVQVTPIVEASTEPVQPAHQQDKKGAK